MAILTSKLGKILTTIVIILLLLIGGVGYVAWYHLKREIPTVSEQ